MVHKMFEGFSPLEIKETLEANSYHKEEMTFGKEFSEEDLEIKKDELSQAYIELGAIEEQKKVVMDEFKDKMNPIKTSLKNLSSEIRSGSETVTEQVYLMDNQEEGMMYYFDDRGGLIKSRRLKPEEKQLSILSASRGGSEEAQAV